MKKMFPLLLFMLLFGCETEHDTVIPLGEGVAKDTTEWYNIGNVPDSALTFRIVTSGDSAKVKIKIVQTANLDSLRFEYCVMASTPKIVGWRWERKWLTGKNSDGSDYCIPLFTRVPIYDTTQHNLELPQ